MSAAEGFNVGFFDTGLLVGFADGLTVDFFVVGFEVGFVDGLAVGADATAPLFVIVGTADAV